ncbi:quinone oxidoreductase [Devosia pacifica]|uniref:Quinone oxidoreductase n=1 Tax=Devosia pacifica TaxID=1335967 RepID=A0A918SCW3_9HYPH|nr:MDR family oxidoreductase [Devosia pacifica]GHA32374.1 quinone oxidoreductase [Devosia pacifica]
MSFKALVSRQREDGSITSQVETLEDDALPDGNVTVAIDHAGLNYKDAFCLTGRGGLVRNYPNVAGIDFAGTVEDSSDDRYKPGDGVILTGWRVGELHWGGYSQKQRVNADWLVPLPKSLDARKAMVLGTAGLTAMLAITRLEELGIHPDSGTILVTGASGGVGSISIMLLKTLGYKVAALTGKPGELDFQALGADEIVERQGFMAPEDRPIDSARYAGAIDTVGGSILGRVLKQISYGGAVASLGNAAGIDFETSVLPFILRGVTLAGIDSVMQPYDPRVIAWERLGKLFDFDKYEALVEEIGLEGLPDAADRILDGKIKGRVLVTP